MVNVTSVAAAAGMAGTAGVASVAAAAGMAGTAGVASVASTRSKVHEDSRYSRDRRYNRYGTLKCCPPHLLPHTTHLPWWCLYCPPAAHLPHSDYPRHTPVFVTSLVTAVVAGAIEAVIAEMIAEMKHLGSAEFGSGACGNQPSQSTVTDGRPAGVSGCEVAVVGR